MYCDPLYDDTGSDEHNRRMGQYDADGGEHRLPQFRHRIAEQDNRYLVL